MQKIFLLLLSLISAIVCTSQTTIQMEEQGGVYRIPCKVNGAKMKLVFDTGATNVCLSQSIAEYLLDNDYITTSDFIGSGQSIVADGRIVDHLKISLRDIEIGGLHLKNIPAVVIFDQQAPLLLGLSAINKLGTITINGNQLIIHKGQSENIIYSEDEIQAISDDALSCAFDGFYELAIEKFENIYYTYGLTPYEMYIYLFCLQSTGRNHDVISMGENALNDFDKTAFSSNIKGCIADAYRDIKDYNNAILYYQKAISSTEELRELRLLYFSYAACYVDKEDYFKANTIFDKSINVTLEYLNLSFSDIAKGDCHDNLFGQTLYMKALCLALMGDNYNATKYTGLAALCGNERANRSLHDSGYTMQNYLKKYFPNRFNR